MSEGIGGVGDANAVHQLAIPNYIYTYIPTLSVHSCGVYSKIPQSL